MQWRLWLAGQYQLRHVRHCGALRRRIDNGVAIRRNGWLAKWRHVKSMAKA